MLDVTALILTDHETLRRQFAALDDARTDEALSAVWKGLARMLDVHAACEEEVFYPSLLKHGEDAEDETDDAIDDHNKIRDGVREAGKHPIGPRSGGTRSASRGPRTASTSPRKSVKPYPTFASTLLTSSATSSPSPG